MDNLKTYSEMIVFPTYEERLMYLKLDALPTQMTFGFQRYLNQKFYKSLEWKRVRDAVIIRDLGCDLGIEDRPLNSNRVLIHHMNPITVDDIKQQSALLLNPEYLICVSKDTHNLIHYGSLKAYQESKTAERKANDTTPWK